MRKPPRPRRRWLRIEPTPCREAAGRSGRRLLLPALILSWTLAGCSGAPSSLPEAAIEANNRGVGLMGQFDFAAAEEEFSRLVDSYPDQLDIQINLAIAVLNRQGEGDVGRAREILDGVLKADPRHVRGLYCRGLLELWRGEPGAAIGYLKSVEEIDPEDPYVAYFLGLALLQESRTEEALAWFQRAIDQDSYLLSAYYKAFQAFQRLGRWEDAADMRDGLERLEKNPRAHRAELKYTVMGPKAEAIAVDRNEPSSPRPPAGPLFGSERPLLAESEGTDWEGQPGRSAITTCDLNGDGRGDFFLSRARVRTAVSRAGGPVPAAHGIGNVICLSDPATGQYHVELAHPLADVDEVNAALWGDVDNDGRTDVYLCRKGPNLLWLQVEDGQWRDVTDSAAAAGGAFDTIDGAIFDADHDGDLDLFLVNADGPDELLNNNRDGTFRPLGEKLGLRGSGAPSRSVVVLDFDGDGDLDLLVIRDRPPHDVLRDDLLWEYRPAEGWSEFQASDIQAAVAGDLDADGQVELYTLGSGGDLDRWTPSTKGSGTPHRLASGSSRSQSTDKGEARPRLAIADLDGDGRQEILVSDRDGLRSFRGTTGDRETRIPWSHGEGRESRSLDKEEPGEGSPVWTLAVLDSTRGPSLVSWDPGRPPSILPPGPGRYAFATLVLSGGDTAGSAPRSNASGIGTRVAARVDSRWTVVDPLRRDSGPGQSLTPIPIGLGGASRIDFVSLDWPDGVLQTELGLESGPVHEITETQRELSSCPVLFAWNGEGFAFVTDLLGVGGVGYLLEPGRYAEPRPRESLRLEETALQPREGKLVLELMEPMEEATYLDAARLTAYDLPPGWSLGLDERMGIAGPEPTGLPFFYRKVLRPSGATNDRGRDVLEALAARDLRAAPPGEADARFIGRLRRENVLTLTFSEPLDLGAGLPVLLADGWVEYPYSQTNFAAWQAGASYDAPTLEARSGGGPWRTLQEQFGYPAGMPRQMSFPLPPLPRHTDQLRLRTNQEIYWDRIAVVRAEPCPEARRHELARLGARLGPLGFPERTEGPQRVPAFDFRRRRPLWDTRVQRGLYTAFGPVDELLAAKDDAVVIFGPGEGVEIEFSEVSDPLPVGWSRVYVFEADGWCKDRDRFTRDGETIEPLPHSAPGSDRGSRLNAAYNKRLRLGPP